MKVAVTGATGFIGRYLVNAVVAAGHEVVAWYRRSPPTWSTDHSHQITWIPGTLRQPAAAEQLVSGCDALIHGALYRPGKTFRGSEGDLVTYVDQNITGSLELFRAAVDHRLQRVVFISSGSVHEQILSDRPLDECHPTWALAHYGAHKAAIEQFVYSYGLGHGLPFCALRPTAVYGVNEPVEHSKWYDLIGRVLRGEDVQVTRGGKEVHVSDVAQCVVALLHAEAVQITGQAFECYDRYISEWDVAHLVKRICNSPSQISGARPLPQHQIVTDKIQRLGVSFGGETLWEQTVQSLIQSQMRTR